ncbi:MAG: hypothetical protein WBB36_15990, partial [Chitinophagales bacterium]
MNFFYQSKCVQFFNTTAHIFEHSPAVLFSDFRKKLLVPILFFFGLFILFSPEKASAQSEGDFRTIQSGNWEDLSTWEEFSDGIWGDPAHTPDNSDGTITIVDGTDVTSSSNLTIDQTIIMNGATLQVIALTLTVDDGVGSDLTIDGDISFSNGELDVNDGAVVDGSANVFYSGLALTNDGSINTFLFVMGASATQTIYGTGSIATFLPSTSAPGGIIVAGQQTITDQISFNNGKLHTAGAAKIIMAEGALIINADADHYVDGNLEQVYSSSGLRTFPIGDFGSYNPIDFSPDFLYTGGMVARTDAGDHIDISNSGINESKSVNRTWTLTSNGLGFTGYTVTFYWNSGELDGGADPDHFVVAKYDAPDWELVPVIARTATSITIEWDEPTASNFQVGELLCDPPVIICAPDITVCQDAAAGACGVLFFPEEIESPVILDFTDRVTTYTNVSINGGGNSAIVLPGSTVSLNYNFSVSFDVINGYCPGCIVQTSIGIGSTFKTLQCEPNIGNGTTGSYTSGDFT